MSVKLHIKVEVYTANSSKDFGLPAIGSEVYIWVEVHCQYQGDFGLSSRGYMYVSKISYYCRGPCTAISGGILVCHLRGTCMSVELDITVEAGTLPLS